MTYPILSVVVANFNNARYLPECLDSILGQSFRELEILIYDDGSSDESRETIRRYGERRPDLVRILGSRTRRGPAWARHRAMQSARGEYLTTLDSDDFYCHPQKLEWEMALVREHRTQGRRVIAFSDIVPVDAVGKRIKRHGRRDPIKEGFIFEEILTRSCLIPRDFIMPLSAYRAVGGYDVSLTIREDWDLKYRLSRRYPFYSTGREGVCYRRQGGGLSARSASSAAEWEKWLVRVFSKNLELAEVDRREEIRNRFQAFLQAGRNRLAREGLPAGGRRKE